VSRAARRRTRLATSCGRYPVARGGGLEVMASSPQLDEVRLRRWGSVAANLTARAVGDVLEGGAGVSNSGDGNKSGGSCCWTRRWRGHGVDRVTTRSTRHREKEKDGFWATYRPVPISSPQVTLYNRSFFKKKG
jgi:hypothetical protein